MSQNRAEQTQNTSGKGLRRVSLQTQLVLFALLVSLVPLIISSTRNIIQTQQALTNNAESSLKSSAAQTANSMDAFIQTTLDTVAGEALFSDFTSYLTLYPATPPIVQARAQDMLNKLRDKSNKHIISYAIVSTDGVVLLDTLGVNINNQESTEAYFQQVQTSNDPIVTDVVYLQDNTPAMTFASKITNINGEYLGILRAKYNSVILQDIITESVRASAADVSVLLLDQFHIRMADSRNPELIQKSIVPLDAIDHLYAVNTRRLLNIPAEEQATNYPEFEAALENATAQPFFKTDMNPETDGDDTVAVSFMRTKPWMIAYSRPTSILFADVEQQTRLNIIWIIFALVIISGVAVIAARSLTNPLITLAKVAGQISQGDLNARAKINASDEIGQLASAFNSMTDQLQSTLVGLEQRINARTADLQKNTQDLEAIAVIAREIFIIRDLDTLMKVSAELIRERFQYHRVGLFLIDEHSEYVILRAASGANADQMLEQNIKLRTGQEGLIGNVIRTGQAQFSLNPGVERLEEPLQSSNHSEVALPLRSRSMTIGVLDIQMDVDSNFREQDVKILQLLADQLAAAIDNAELVLQVEKTYAELNNAYRQQSRDVWKTAIDQYERPGYEYDGMQVRPVPQQLSKRLLNQLEAGEPIFYKENSQNGNKEKTVLMVPLMVLNQVIGVVGLEREDPHHVWTDEEIAIAQAAANRAGITLENARLIEESQRRALKERTIFAATERIGSAMNVGNILHTTAEEIERILGSAEVILQFNNDNASSTNEE